MNTAISAITRTSRSLGREVSRIARRLTHKAKIKLGITLSLPPFLKIALDYTADLGEPANHNRPDRQPSRTA